MHIRYIISSHVRYASFTLPRLLTSMNNIDPDDVFVALGGADRSEQRASDHATVFAVNHNSFDYTGIIEVIERELAGDWWFWMHDTCECGPEFRRLVEGNCDPTKEMTVVYVESNRNLCNFGLYNSALLHRHAGYFRSLKNLSKQEAISHEGALYRDDLGTKAIYPNSGYHVIGHRDIYQNGTQRMIEHYSAVDLFKFKGNWGATGPGSYIVDA